ncbi:MAG: DUF1800 domain-containing protein [Betaproteobacteria bacterium]|nr:DUF1800 domain-containing protein [Betaproteobacteria bacterium]
MATTLRKTSVALLLTAAMLAGCASIAPREFTDAKGASTDPVALLNRITWGATAASKRDLQSLGVAAYVDRQLRPEAPRPLPVDAETRVAAMTITRQPLAELVMALERRRKEADGIAEDADKKAAQQAYQQELTRLGNEAATRSLLRTLYSDRQLQEQMVWFWMNHFSIFQGKANLRAMIGDFEERAIRPHALGRFRDLLAATVHHPAMLRYLDNEQNAAGRINENYARELMELHTLGVGGGYTQKDVQELARVLTGLGINQTDKAPDVRTELKTQYVRDGLFEFNPNRHDYGDKEFLGQVVKGRGLAEVDEVIDRLSRDPAAAQYVSRKLATYFVADTPPPPLVERMARVFLRSDGNIADTVRVMIASPEFAASLNGKFKDPVHYVVSAVRLAYGNKVILNASPMLGWLNRMGQPVYGRQTPDGYPQTQTAWASAGQMMTRFEIAKAIGSGSAGLFKTVGPDPVERAAFPQVANALYYQAIESRLAPATLDALDQAKSPQEWNTFLLASPEFMTR